MNVSDLIKKNFPFEEFRDQQYEVLEKIVNSLSKDTDYFILESPTGVGKSCIGYTSARTLLDTLDIEEDEENGGPEVLICTKTRQLQLQYVESFKDEDDVSYIWSARNYECSLFPELEGTDEKVYYAHPLCPKKKCPVRSQCKYLEQKDEFVNSQIGITNYHYFMNFKKLRPTVLICDEAHNIEKLLCDEASIIMSERQLISFSNNILRNSEKVRSIDIKKFLDKIKDLVNKKEINIKDDIVPYANDFIAHFKPIFTKVKNELDSKTKNVNSHDKKGMEKLGKLAKLQNSIENAIDKYESFIKSEVDWVISNVNKERENNKINIKPLEISEFFYDHIGGRIQKGIFMSATICGFKEFSKQLDLDNYDYVETDSIIPVENRTVYYCKNIGSINYKNKLQILPQFIKVIDRIIKYQYKKEDKIHGVIHTVSYDNANYIKKNSEYSDNIIIPNRNDLLELNDTIYKSKESKIIVSPSILEGIDLIDDLSRFQIFIKVPFNFLGDKWVKTKMNMNKKWYSREAIIKIVQGSGRSIRSEEDWAETFILDSNFGRLINQDNELFPSWFKESINTVNV